MAYCCVPFCKSDSKKSKNLSFHEFPVDLDLRQKWLKAISRDNFTPNTNSCSNAVCSLHFQASDYKEGLKKRFLKPLTVPSIFPDCPLYKVPEVKPPRKTTVRNSPTPVLKRNLNTSEPIQNEQPNDDALPPSSSETGLQKMASTSSGITAKEFGRRFRKALSVPFLLKQVCSTNVTDFVTAYSNRLGCTEKSFFFPLMTCAAACMGTECYVELSSLWHEPAIVWTLVITPTSLLRVDVAEHLKHVLLKVQNEMWSLGKDEDSKECLKKFIFDMVSLDQLHDILKLSNGHGLAIYNSTWSLHKLMFKPEEIDIMLRLHSGLGWFSDSRVNRNTLTKTRVNFSVLSAPSAVQQTLNSAPNFEELFYQTFFTVCAEESHAKFEQFSEHPDTEKLHEIFLSLMKLHHSQSIVYKLSAEASEKFGQIHNELTDKGKQIARKNAPKVYQPALSYLGRLSCILHVLDNVIDAINYKVPISTLTWNTEISATTVWHARELLGHMIEQRHALMEQTTIDASQPKVRAPAIDLVGGQPSAPIQRSPGPMVRSPGAAVRPQMMNRTPQMVHRPMMVTPPRNIAPRRTFQQNTMVRPTTATVPVNNVRRNLSINKPMPNTNDKFNNILGQQAAPNADPLIVSVHSAGLPVHNKEQSFNPVISGIESINNSSGNSITTGLNLPSSLSVSVADDSEAAQPILLSRSPYSSVADLSEEDFLSSNKTSIKRLLMHNISEITPSRCVQLKLTPNPTASDEEQKYTASFARSFLKKLESLGFGICDGPKNGSLRHFVFKKKKYSALTDKQVKILQSVNVSEIQYNKCFVSGTSQKTNQNGSVVCLE